MRLALPQAGLVLVEQVLTPRHKGSRKPVFRPMLLVARVFLYHATGKNARQSCSQSYSQALKKARRICGQAEVLLCLEFLVGSQFGIGTPFRIGIEDRVRDRLSLALPATSFSVLPDSGFYGRLLLFAELEVVELAVDALEGQEFIVAARLGNATVVKH